MLSTPVVSRRRGHISPWPAALVALALSLSACATAPLRAGLSTPHGAPPPRRQPSSVPPIATTPLRFADLPGWSDEDHVAALQAFVAGCGIARDPSMRVACAHARALGSIPEGAARQFFEFNFRPVSLAEAGVLTAYFAPEYEARAVRDDAFTAPVRPMPSPDAFVAPTRAAPAPAPAVLDPLDLLDDAASASMTNAPSSSPRAVAAVGADRATLEAAPAPDALAWMRPEDLFFLQIQGSGVLDFPDGRRLKAAYAGDNGRPFVAIARPMLRRGLLRADRLSGEAIRGWLATHAGPEADAVMDLDPRYVFFALTSYDGADPRGAAGIPLPPGRAIAIDPSRHAFGELYWIQADAPVLTGAVRRYHRLALTLDTGSAIRGEVRADLYLGRGHAAGIEAGRVRHVLHLVRLMPIATGL